MSSSQPTTLSLQEAAADRACEYRWLGPVEYKQAWDLQRDLARRRALGETPDTLLLLEHPPVYTTGRRGARENLRLPPNLLGAPLIESDRGGDITFHGPGQLVGYPVMDLRAAGLTVVSYVRALEETILRALHEYGVDGSTESGLTGVWVGENKVAAIGVRVGKPAGAHGGWVTGHGFAINVDVDLGWFERIVPCGVPGRGVTSIKALTGESPPLPRFAATVASAFGDVFGRAMIEPPPPPSSRV